MKNSTNLSAKSLGRFINPSILACSLKHRLGLTIIWGVVVISLNFCLKEFRCGLHADSIVLVDFLHVLGSIEGRFISATNYS